MRVPTAPKPSDARLNLACIERDLRRGLLGYRREDVEGLVAELEADAGREAENARAHAAHSAQLASALETTRQACFDRDRRLVRLEAELDLSRSEAQSTLRGLAALGAELEALRVSSRATATRIRLQALGEAGAVGGAIRDLGTLPDNASESLLAAVERAIDRVASDWSEAEDDLEASEELAAAAAAPPAAPAADLIAPPEPEGEITVSRGDGGGGGEADGRRVRVDVGPFQDFSQLVSFEDAANAISATGEISIRRFSGGRAEIDMDLTGPVDLLRELEQRFDLDFEVRSSEGNEIILDLGR